MIDSIGTKGPAGVDNSRLAGVQKPAAAGKAAAKAETQGAAPNPAADLAAAGPPVDLDKVSQVRAAIANGSYHLDIEAIASRMVEIDILPRG